MSKVIGIDQSMTSTGWCLYDDELGDEHIVYGLVTSDKNKSKFQRFIDIAYEVSWLVETHKADTFVIEGLPMGNIRGNVSRDLAGLQAVIYCDVLNGLMKSEEGMKIVAPTALKKFATGSGRASKEEMFESLPDIVRDKFVSTPKTRGRYDLTDSYWLARYGESL